MYRYRIYQYSDKPTMTLDNCTFTPNINTDPVLHLCRVTERFHCVSKNVIISILITISKATNYRS